MKEMNREEYDMFHARTPNSSPLSELFGLTRRID